MKASEGHSMQTNLAINYYGYFTPFGGYGIANINWVKHLLRRGIDVSVHGQFAPKPGTREWEILSEEEREIFKRPFVKQKIGIIETNPFNFESNVSEIKIANTMCESDHVSASWPEKLNTMQHIVVPNEFNKRVFEESGVTVPITVIPHGTETEKFRFYERPKRDTFTFTIAGFLDITDRKGAFDVIRAFVSEFSENEPVRLLLKSSDMTFGYYKRFTKKNIKTIAKHYSFEEMYELFKETDCFVFPSKAEGIGQPPREAMATGLPVILTDWSGLADIANPGICYPIKPASLEPRPNFIEQNGNWAKIDIKELMYWMRYVYEHQDEAREKGRKAAWHIRKHFSWGIAAKKMEEFLCSLNM